MAFPYIFESNFEQGTNGEWDSEADTGSKLSFPHYSQLARYDAANIGSIAPFRGAYVAELDLGDTNDHTLIEGDIDIANAVTRYVRFYLFLGKDLRATADNTFALYEHQGTANAVEASVGLRITASTGAVDIGVGFTVPTVFAASSLRRGQWYCIELSTTVSTGVAGTSTLYVDGSSVAVIADLTNTAVLRGVLGSQDTAATTLGHIFIDRFAFDDTRLFPTTDRYPEVMVLTKSTHVAVGETDILNMTLIPGAGTNNTVKLYDTDVAYVSDESNVNAILSNLTASEPPIDLADVPMAFKRGVYAELSGTGTKVLVRIGHSLGYGSVGRIRDYGNKRKNHPTAG